MATTTTSDKNMTIEEVRSIYNSMGKEPTQADLSYWTNQPVSQKNALYEILYNRVSAANPIGTIGQDSGKIFMRGDQALVMFSDDLDGPGPASTSTVWLVDKTTKTLRPFLSVTAFNGYYRGVTDFATEWQKGTITTLPSTILNSPNSDLNQFKPLPDSMGIQNNGTIPADTGLSEADLGKLYGMAYNEDASKATLSILDNYLKLVKDTPDTNIPDSLIDSILGDHTRIALYTNALTYGGYGLNDVYRDIKRQALAQAGDKSMEGLVVIHPTTIAEKYFATADSRFVRTSPNLSPPDKLGNIDTSLLNLSIFDLPDEMFSTLLQPIDWTTQQARDEAAQIKSAYHDVLMKQLEAQTDQEKANADYEYDLFREELNRAYGIQLSDNVTQAWNQIENLVSGYAYAGLPDSGLQAESIDKELTAIRKKDEAARQYRLSTEETAQRKHFLASASPEEIASLTDAQREAWGLKPSQDIVNFLDIQNLMSTYGLSEQEAREYHDLTIDENGNYRSQLYSTLFANMYGVQKSKESYQRDQLFNKYLNDEETAFAELNGSGAFTSGYLGNQTSATGNEITSSQQTANVGSSTAGTLWTNGSITIDPVNYGYLEEADLRNQGFSPVTPTISNPTIPAGYTRISGPTELSKYTENQIWRDPNSNNIYLKPTSTPTALSTPTPTTTSGSRTIPNQNIQTSISPVPEPSQTLSRTVAPLGQGSTPTTTSTTDRIQIKNSRTGFIASASASDWNSSIYNKDIWKPV